MTAADYERLRDENTALLCRIDELETENRELREEIADCQWTHKDDQPREVGRRA